MPLITLRANKISSEKVRNSLTESLSLITEKTLRKNKEVIVVRFDVADQQAQWYVGGAVKSDDGAIFELSIIVTKGTNTDEEKAEWIAEAWKLVTQILGSAPHPNYISIQEIDGKSWGYNGLTQEQRKNPTNSNIDQQMSENDQILKKPPLGYNGAKKGNISIPSHNQLMSNGQIKFEPFPYNSINDKVFNFLGMENVSLATDLEFEPYQPDLRKGVGIHTIFSLVEQDPQGPDAAIIKYEPGAFVALHEHIGYEMVLVLTGDYIENGVTFLPGSLILRSPGTFHTLASVNGCTFLATRYIKVKQRPDLWNEFALSDEDVKPV